MNAIELLKEQHREVEKLFQAIEEADGQDEQLKYFQQLASKLVGHDGIEREMFENLRQVLAGTLKPNVEDADEKDDGAKPRRRRSSRRRSARQSV
jgi:hypothetical protein